MSMSRGADRRHRKQLQRLIRQSRELSPTDFIRQLELHISRQQATVERHATSLTEGPAWDVVDRIASEWVELEASLSENPAWDENTREKFKIYFNYHFSDINVDFAVQATRVLEREMLWTPEPGEAAS